MTKVIIAGEIKQVEHELIRDSVHDEKERVRLCIHVKLEPEGYTIINSPKLESNFQLGDKVGISIWKRKDQ